MDDQYQTYLNRVVGMTRKEHYQNQWTLVQPSPKFQYDATGAPQPAVFPGYSLITPIAAEDQANPRFYPALQTVQQTLIEVLPQQLLIPLPPASFHLTIADLIWENHYRQAQEQPGFDQKLQQQIQAIFAAQMKTAMGSGNLQLQVLGFMAMPRAIGICLAPHTEADYERIVSLRRAIYQDADLLALGIEQQYHFTAHITLGYFGQVPDSLDANVLAEQLTMLNQKTLEALPEMTIERVELRKFDNMINYYRDANWPVFALTP
ncbi:MAG: DUF1868 domain-containing protein [Cyanobacteria bacterium P01_H01_bin.121]